MAGLTWTVKFDKEEDFMGKSALVSQKEKGLSHQVIHFTLEGKRIAREGTSVRSTDGKIVGTVLSGTYSPICECPIGSALIAFDAQQEALLVDLRKHSTQLRLKKLRCTRISLYISSILNLSFNRHHPAKSSMLLSQQIVCPPIVRLSPRAESRFLIDQSHHRVRLLFSHKNPSLYQLDGYG